MSNLKAIFQYQEYNILKDNGKNFNQYQSELELYDHVIRAYSDEADALRNLAFVQSPVPLPRTDAFW